jgi:hypothetical protein
MEEQDTIPYHLTDEQVAEVSRRRADFAACKERYASDEDELLQVQLDHHVLGDLPTFEALLASGGVVSVQVLNEFASVASRKLAMTVPEIREILSTVRAVCIVNALDIETHELVRLRIRQRARRPK